MAQDHVVYRTGFAVNLDGTPVSPEELEKFHAVFNKALERCFRETRDVSDDAGETKSDVYRPSVADMLGTESGRIHDDVARGLPSRRQVERALADLEAGLAASWRGGKAE